MDHLHAVEDGPQPGPERIDPGRQDPQRDADRSADDHGNDDHPDRLHGEIPVLVAEQPAHEEAGRAAQPHQEVPGRDPQQEEQQQHHRPREPVLQQVVDDELQQLVDGPLDGLEEPPYVGGQPEDDLLDPQTEGDLPLVEVAVVPESGGERTGVHSRVSLALVSFNCSETPSTRPSSARTCRGRTDPMSLPSPSITATGRPRLEELVHLGQHRVIGDGRHCFDQRPQRPVPAGSRPLGRLARDHPDGPPAGIDHVGRFRPEAVDGVQHLVNGRARCNRRGILAHGLDGQHPALVDILDELRHILGLGAHEDVLGRAGLMDGSVLHDAHPCTDPERFVEIVGDEQDRLVELVLDLHQLVLHLAADQRIEGAECLVHQQDVGVGGERPGKPHPLLHASAELPREAGLVTAESDERERPLRRLVARLGDRRPSP